MPHGHVVVDAMDEAAALGAGGDAVLADGVVVNAGRA